MPDKRNHRGPHPEDANLFAAAKIKNLRSAVADFSLLLTRGYADKSALKLVGDRYSLTERQRLAVMRCACSDQQLVSRRQRQVEIAQVANNGIAIDGYNVLITIEAAISGGIIFKGRDSCHKDLASIHGTYRKVAETIPALQLIGEFLSEAAAGECTWFIDSPVSNSGRLKTLIRQLAEKNQWKWSAELLFNPDTELIASDMIAATSDSIVLDGCQKWVNLAAEIIKRKMPLIEVVDLSSDR